MKHHPSISNKSFRQRGQSLVEVALFFPIFVLLLAGVIEVSQLIVTQNRVTNAARVGARFGANGGDDSGMVATALNSITQTLGQDESEWDVWTIRAEVNSAGDDFDEWEFEHVYGISNTARYSDVVEADIRSQVLAELQSSGDVVNTTAGIRIVGTLMIHDVQSILGLNALPFVADINSIQELNVMRIVGLNNEPTLGCDAFPIAIHEGIRSTSPVGQGASPYPERRDFGNDSPKPEYREFPNHVPDIPLSNAKEGTVFKVQNGFGEGSFGWLRWNQGRPNDANTLNGSLTWPGNSKDYTTSPNGGSGVGDYGRINGYVEPGDLTDTSLHIGDIVAANTGATNTDAVRGTLQQHIRRGRVLRVIIWNEARKEGNYGEYRVIGFAKFRLQGYNLSSGGQGGDSWILAEFIGWDTSCGQLSQIP